MRRDNAEKERWEVKGDKIRKRKSGIFGSDKTETEKKGRGDRETDTMEE